MEADNTLTIVSHGYYFALTKMLSESFVDAFFMDAHLSIKMGAGLNKREALRKVKPVLFYVSFLSKDFAVVKSSDNQTTITCLLSQKYATICGINRAEFKKLLINW